MMIIIIYTNDDCHLNTHYTTTTHACSCQARLPPAAGSLASPNHTADRMEVSFPVFNRFH